MKVKYIEKSYIDKISDGLLLKYPDIKCDSKVDVIALATRCLGLKICFEDLKPIYGKNTLGMLFDSKIIICDRLLEPCGENRNNRENILRFTIAHEIGHYILHSEYMDSKNQLYFHKNLPNKEQCKLETQANMFAASLLMPASYFKEFYQDISESAFGDYERLERMADRFKVSKETAGFRIKNLRL